MTTAQAQSDVENAGTTFEGEIREFVRRDFTSLTRPEPLKRPDAAG